jgi:hypothetical protein
MNATPDSMLANPRDRLIADLQRQLAASNAERDEALARATATAEVLQVINSSPGDLAPVFDVILEKAVRLCEAALGVLSTFTEDGLVTHRAFRGPPEIANYLRGRPPTRPGSGTTMARLLEGEDCVHVPDATAEEVYRRGDPGRRTMVDLAGARTLVGVALRKDEVLLGAITLYRREVRPFSDKEIGLVANFAAQAVIAMENARLLTETREALEQQTATAEVLQVINASPGDLAPVFDAMLDRAIRLCEAAYGVLWTYDGEGFRAATLHGVPQPYAKHLSREPTQLARGTNTALGQIADGSDFAHFDDVATEEGYMISGARRLIELARSMHEQNTLG